MSDEISLNEFKKMLKSAPLHTVDQVYVVRCKNCKHWEEQPSDGKLGGFGICSELGGGWDGNEFCSYGVRRDEND